MALTFVTTSGTLVIPGAYPSVRVAADNSGLSANGVLMLVGEADGGPKWTEEDDLELNAFGPDQVAAVVAKYRSGNLVDAFRAASVPANDVNIAGAPAAIVVVKTNDSTKASRGLVNFAAGAYGSVADKGYGKLGNLIQSSVVAGPAESVPTTGSFTFIPAVGTVNAELRVNGGAALGLTLSANATPDDFVTAADLLAGVDATGGADRSAHPTTGTLAATHSGVTLSIVSSTTWTTTPSIGDTLVIPAGSVIEGTGTDNVGAYVVTAASATTVAATKLSDAGQVGATIGAVTDCVTVTATAVGGSPEGNVVVYSPVVLALTAADPTDGIAKTLEIAELTTGTDLLSRTAFALSTSAVDWVSSAATPTLINSTAEYAATLAFSRQADSVTESLTVGGDVGLTVGYEGTTATITIAPPLLTTTVVGGTGSNLSLVLADFSTIADLAARIATETGYTASPGSAAVGQRPATALDRVVAQGICTSHGANAGQIKIDAYTLAAQLGSDTVLCDLVDNNGDIGRADAGLPAPQAAGFLSGGTKGGTTGSDVSAALGGLERVPGNFVCSLFSRDASEDIADGGTESSSTYTIDGINGLVRSHVTAMSTLKRRRHRQAFVSKRTTFAEAKSAAAGIANPRVAMTFQDVRLVDGNGAVSQFQPWMGGVLAAGMQAAGFYRAIFAKGINASGFIQAARDFDDRDDTAVEQALKTGLLVARRRPSGGFAWVSDQTTYSRDSNFVYNSIQAIYAADLIANTTAQRMELAFLGQSVADVSAALAKSYLDSIMSDLLRLRLIAPSTDAVKGYRNAQITISGPVMLVSLEVKLAGAIYFIPINFLVSQVQQSA